MSSPTFAEKKNPGHEVKELSRNTSEDEESGVSTEQQAGPQQVNASPRRELWLWEIAGLTISALSLAGLMALVAALDNKPLPTWSQAHSICAGAHGYTYCGNVTVSVNSIIAWLCTAAKICVLIPITRSLGQLKWIWFSEQERSLTDLDKFDSAARGLTGSLTLAWALRGRHFAVIGAVAVVLSLAFDPFVQNLVSYDVQYTPTDKTAPASISNATTYNPNTDSIHADATQTVGMKSNILAGLYNIDDSWATSKYICPSGNCTYSNYASLGVCAQCTDITDLLSKNCATYNGSTGVSCAVSLPNNFTLKADKVYGNTNVMHISTPSIADVDAYRALDRPLAIIDAITAFGTFAVNQTSPVVASECVLTACVRSYNTSVGSGSSTSSALAGAQYNESVVHTWLDYIIDDNVDTVIAIPSQPELGIHGDTNFTIPYNIQHGLSFYITELLSGSVGTQGTGDYEYRMDGQGLTSRSSSTGDMMQAIYLGNYSNCATPENGNICAMQNLATAMTKAIRDEAWSNSSLTMAQGQVFVPKTYIHVTWFWIILPILIWVLALVMLVGTIIKTKRAGLWAWRLNPLALIFLGFDQDSQEHMEESHQHEHGLTEKGLEKKAETLKVRLRLEGQKAVMAKCS